MADKIVDASALGAIIFKEPERAETANRLEGERLLAPTLLHFEVVNICLTKLRRNPEDRRDILRAFALFVALPIETAEVDHAGVLALGEQYRLTAYDASYLWLAQQMNAELVTLDRQLARAAARLRGV
jgi:predicted nucleic acid-binding protein